MEITPASLVLRSIERHPAASGDQPFVQGQRLVATVMEQRSGYNQLLLKIHGQLFRAQSSLRINPGERLQVEVISTGTLPRLKIMDPEVETLQQAIRANIGRQTTPESLLKNLISTLRPSTPGGHSPTALKSLAADFVQKIPAADELTNSRGLKQAFANSGLFLESRLLSSARPDTVQLNLDLKARLLRLVSRLESRSALQPDNEKIHTRSSIPQDPASVLHKTIEENARGVLGKLVLDQISSLPTDSGDRQVWNVNLPFMDDSAADSARISIQKEPARPDHEEESEWSVVLELNPSRLGRIRSRIALSGLNVNVHMITESESTRSLITDRIHLLDRSLLQAGLSTESLTASSANLGPAPEHNYPIPIVDESV